MREEGTSLYEGGVAMSGKYVPAHRDWGKPAGKGPRGGAAGWGGVSRG